MIRIGIIGCGRISERRHVPEYATNPYCEIAGYYNRTAGRAEAMAAKYGGVVYPSIEDMLSDPQIDAVSVCTPNVTHAEVTIQALCAGKHVLCEKPMALTVEECEAMVQAARDTGKLLMIAQNQRYNTGHARARELIAQGIIGKPLSFKTSFCHGGPERWIEGADHQLPTRIWFYDKSTAGMGAMADLGIHKMDLIQYLLDQKISEVTAKIATLDKKDENGNLIQLEDNGICILKMENGVYGTLTASWTDYGEEDNSTVIFGTRGLMRLYDNTEHTISISTDRGDKIYYDLDRMQTNIDQNESGMIKEFIEEIRSENWRHAANDASVNAIRAVLAAFESSKLDKTIKL